MKIGILTYHCVTNFGAQLQTLSTVGYMKKHGHEPVVLNWFPQDLEDFYLQKHPRVQFDEQFQFAMNKMPVSRLCRTLEELTREISRLELDAIFVGSDALFDYTPERLRSSFSIRKLQRVKVDVSSNHDLPNPFWGSFNDTLQKKIPYCGFSISSQNMPYFKLSRKESKELSRLLNNFSLITARDEWTRKMIEQISGRKDVEITPDPVFAFNHNYDNSLDKKTLLDKYNLPENYILISFCKNILSDSFVNQIVSDIEKRTGYTCVSFPMPRRLKKFDTTVSIELPLPTLDWYYLIKYSQGYIGELMHPIIVSLHNSVPFFCFDQYGTYKTIIPKIWKKFVPESSKIYDILSRAGFIDNMCSYNNIDAVTPAVVVDRFLAFDKQKCNAFSQAQYDRYVSGMHDVMNSLTKQ